MAETLTMDDLLKEVLRLRKALHVIASPSFLHDDNEANLHKRICDEKEMLAYDALRGDV